MATPSTIYNGTLMEEAVIYNLAAESIYSVTALVVYAHLLLLGQEIEYVWKKPARPSSLLYASIRYPGLVYQLISAGINSYTPNCNAVWRLDAWSEVIAMVATYALQILRAYAVCGKRTSLVLILLVTMLPAVAMSILSAIRANCISNNPLSPTETNIANAFDILSESIVFYATLSGTWAQVRTMRELNMGRGSLAESILRNGGIYYGIFLVAQGCNLITANLAQTPLVVKTNLFANEISFPLRIILSCQFILELRARSARMSDSEVTLATMSSLHAHGTSVVDAVDAVIDADFGEQLVHGHGRSDGGRTASGSTVSAVDRGGGGKEDVYELERQR